MADVCMNMCSCGPEPAGHGWKLILAVEIQQLSAFESCYTSLLACAELCVQSRSARMAGGMREHNVAEHQLPTPELDASDVQCAGTVCSLTHAMRCYSIVQQALLSAAIMEMQYGSSS